MNRSLNRSLGAIAILLLSGSLAFAQGSGGSSSGSGSTGSSSSPSTGPSTRPSTPGTATPPGVAPPPSGGTVGQSPNQIPGTSPEDLSNRSNRQDLTQPGASNPQDLSRPGGSNSQAPGAGTGTPQIMIPERR